MIATLKHGQERTENDRKTEKQKKQKNRKTTEKTENDRKTEKQKKQKMTDNYSNAGERKTPAKTSFAIVFFFPAFPVFFSRLRKSVRTRLFDRICKKIFENYRDKSLTPSTANIVPPK